MKSSNLWGKIAVFLIVSNLSLASADVKYGGGTGEPNDPYQIWDANHMQAIGADANDWDKHFVLMADIDLGGFDGKDGRDKFNIIGTSSHSAFAGVFDGNDHTLSNLTYESDGVNHIALFGYVGSGGKIKELVLEDININAGSGDRVGGLVGYNADGTILLCRSSGSIRGNKNVGGLVGANRVGGSITRCSSSATVGGYTSVGGLVGLNSDGAISNCFASGTVTGDHQNIGGLVGNHHAPWSTLCNSYATGSVSGNQYVGGLVGMTQAGIISDSCYATGTVSGNRVIGGLVGYLFRVTISNCYATGSVIGGSEYIGGLVGISEQSPISRCYAVGSVAGTTYIGGLVGSNRVKTIADTFWDSESSGLANMCGIQESGGSGCNDGAGKTTTEMHQQSTFTDWDFINVWNIGENQTYPYLRTVPAGDINKDRIVNFLDVCIIAEKWCNEQ